MSTFHEFGAALGAAVVSSTAAANLAGTSPAGLSRGFATAALAAATALVTRATDPGRRPPWDGAEPASMRSPAGMPRDRRDPPAGRRRRHPGDRPHLARGMG